MIHSLGKPVRDRTSNRRSTSMTRSAFRAFATLSVAVATLTPVATSPVVAAIVCPAGAVTWVASGSGNWSDGANWSTGAMPTPGQNVCVEDPAVTVTVDFNVAANQLVTAGTINIDQFWTLTLNGPSDIERLTTDGALAGAGPVTITGAGSSWTSGGISTTLEIASTADIDIAGNTAKNLTGTLINRGTVFQTGRSLRIGTVTNHGTWYLTYPSDATVIEDSTALPTFTNFGTVERSGTTAGMLADVKQDVGFINHGTINARTGELQISGFQAIGDGAEMHADGGALFIMSAVTGTPGATVTGASTITGTGIVDWRANMFTLAAGAVVDARSGFLFNGADIAGPGKVSISGPASWERGTVSGNLEVAPTGTLTFTHNASITNLYVTGNVTNNGTVLQADADLYVARFGVAGEITNNGLWQLTNVGSKGFMIRGEAGTPGSFVNNGDLEGSATAGLTGLHSTLDLQNNGTVAARSGQFWIRSAPTHYASPILTGGTWEARNGSALLFPTTFSENNANLRLTGPGSFFGYLGGSDVFATNTGTFRLTEGADYATAGSFTNTGTLSAGSATMTDIATLTVNGDLVLGATSTVEIGVGGTPGEMRYGMINVTGAATLDGTFQAQVLNSYEPVPTHSYQVMTYASMGGAFASIDVAPFYDADVRVNDVLLIGIDPIPIADAGGPYSVAEGTTDYTLDGSGSDDPGVGVINSYEWLPAGSFALNTIEVPNFTDTMDDSSIPVTLTVCDDALAGSQCDTDSAVVVVTNVAPALTVIADFAINEGDTFGPGALATFTDPGAADTHTSTIDWGDGTPIEGGATAASINGSHTYAESGDYQITVTVADDDGGVDTKTIEVEVANVAPTVTPDTPTLDEGDGISSVIIATFSDPGVETFSATMDWGDSTSIDTTVSVNPSTITGSHSYADNGSYTGTVCLTDDGAPVCPTVPVIVMNVRPTMDVTETLVSRMVGDLVTINGTYSDVGANDTHTADVDWKDGSSDLPIAVSGNTFQFTHTYTTDGSFTVNVCVEDDDGGRSCDTVAMDIDPIPNLAPEVDAGGPYTTTEGSAADIAGIASDPNGDPFATEWTSPSGGTFGDPNALTTTFTAPDEGTFTITLTATDSPFGVQASDDAQVTVTNVAPSIDSLSVDSGLPEGSNVNLAATFSDPGVDDTHSATIDWGDPAGTPLPATLTGNSVSGSHLYTQDGTYTVILCVSDDDGGETCSTTDITIVNVLPTVTAAADQEIDQGDTLGPMDIASFTDPGADSWTATVDWGDGSGEEPASVDPLSMTVSGEHTYAGAGTFTATVCVSDEQGRHCDGFAVTVAETSTQPPETTPPVANAGGPYRGHEGRWIKIDGSASSDEDGRIVSYHWTTDGGRFSNPNIAKPKFKAPDNGTYTLTLEVTDNDGLTDRTTTTVIVLNSAPRVNSGRNATIRTGQEHSLRATYTDPGADTHQTIIDWGDGSQTTVDPSQSPVKSNHRYDKPGKYTVRVTVIDDDGGRDTDTHKVTVKNARTDHRKKIRDFIRKLLDKLHKHWRYRGGWAR